MLGKVWGRSDSEGGLWQERTIVELGRVVERVGSRARREEMMALSSSWGVGGGWGPIVTETFHPVTCCQSVFS